MQIEDIERVYRILPELEEARRKLTRARELKTLNVLHGITRELADYAPPSNIGIAFRTMKAALIELHEKELDGILGALRALGVSIDY